MRVPSNPKPLCVGIVGGSASGKTWLADQLHRHLHLPATRISQDNFYRHRPYLSSLQRKRINFDHPRSLDWPLWSEILEKLCQGHRTEVPVYDFSESLRRTDSGIEVCPENLLLVDGLWLFRRPKLRSLFSVRLFLDCPDAVRLARRLERDKTERRRTDASIHQQFRTQVQPMHRAFVDPQKRWADWVLPSPIDENDIPALARWLTHPDLAQIVSDPKNRSDTRKERLQALWQTCQALPSTPPPGLSKAF